MEDKDLDKLFRDAFIDAEETPDKAIWDKIETNLEQETPIIPLYRKRIWPSYAAAAILLLGLGVYFGIKINAERNNHDNLESNAIAEQTIEKSTIETSSSKDITVEKPFEAPHTIVPRKEVQLAKTTATIDSQEKEEELARSYTKLKALPEPQLVITQVKIDKSIEELPIVRQVTEIEDIKPLFEFEEEEETMWASSNSNVKENKNIITTLLNKISENIETKSDEKVRFYADDEGSFGINIINSIAKNRNKKRK